MGSARRARVTRTLSPTSGSSRRWRNSWTAVASSVSPKIRNMNENSSSSAAPRAMNAARNTSAITMPIVQDLRPLGGRDREAADDDHEHEQVVHRKALLHDVPREVLRPKIPSVQQREHHAEQHGHGDIENRPSGRLGEVHLVRAAAERDPVEHKQTGDRGNGGHPSCDCDCQHPFMLANLVVHRESRSQPSRRKPPAYERLLRRTNVATVAMQVRRTGRHSPLVVVRGGRRGPAFSCVAAGAERTPRERRS